MSNSETSPALVRFVARPLGIFACLATALPFSRANHWWVRVFDFPRTQVSTIGAAAWLLGRLGRSRGHQLDPLLDVMVPGAIAAQLAQIYRYTPLAPKQVVTLPQGAPERTLSLISANVRMRNRNSPALIKCIEGCNPDLILVLEPDRWWEQRLQAIEEEYPFTIKCPQDDTYGLLFYSRFPLINPELRFLIQSNVPSIRAQIRLRNGRHIHFYGVHPKPPGRETREGDLRGSGPRDAELVVVANEIRHLDAPVIVSGDFNDVAWSYTTRRFQRIGRVLDPRVGRGMYNTFHAQYPFLRFPLDHFFHSRHFALLDFHREQDIGSDHFPIFARLSLEPEVTDRQSADPADASDFADARSDLRGQTTTGRPGQETSSTRA